MKDLLRQMVIGTPLEPLARTLQSVFTQERSSGRKDVARNQSIRGLICLYPFYNLQIFYKHLFVCCPDWTRQAVGNIRQKTIQEIWNSDKIRYVRRKMYAGEWTSICNICCPYISQYRHSGKTISYDDLENYDVLSPELIKEIRERKDYMDSPPTGFKLDNSNTCNLDCIMCTRKHRNDDNELIKATSLEINKYLPNARSVVLCGSGEPFAITHTRELLYGNYSNNPNLRFSLITNALLLPKYWEKIKHQNFSMILISIDGATKNTYEYIRKGGKWEDLIKSLALIRDNRNKFAVVSINMTVMRSNYKEVPAFIEFAREYGFTATFQKVRGSFGKENFFRLKDEKCIGELADIVKSYTNQNHQDIFWGDLMSLI